MKTKLSYFLPFSFLCLIILGQSGCRTPQEYRKQADKSAYTIVDTTRRNILKNNQNKFNIESPEITLRRRLIALQDLPAYSSATLSSDEMEKPKHWPENI